MNIREKSRRWHFLIKYRADTADKVKKHVFLESVLFQMKLRSLFFRAYLGIMQSLYNYEDLLFLL
jgi:hypothetical protein